MYRLEVDDRVLIMLNECVLDLMSSFFSKIEIDKRLIRLALGFIRRGISTDFTG